MSEQITSSEEIKSELKKALMTGNIHAAEKLLQAGKQAGAFTEVEFMQLKQAIEKTKFGVANPVQDPELYAIIAKM